MGPCGQGHTAMGGGGGLRSGAGSAGVSTTGHTSQTSLDTERLGVV
jgi:hypothetical protein